MATWFVRPVAGNDANAGNTFAAAFKTLGGATAAKGVASGDTIRVEKSADPTSLGSCTWTNGSTTVTIPSGLTLTVETCDAAWTAAANVTATATTTTGVGAGTQRQGTNCAKFALAAAFTTGIVAYQALGASTDFSSMKQISFWIQTSVAFASGNFTLRLCSDTVGAVPVNTITIPAVPGINTWQIVTVDTAGALGAAIQSVSLYANTDIGAANIYLDNILACKDSTSADAITLSSLIGKNTAGEPLWYGVRSITGTSLVIDTAANGTTFKNFPGASETVTSYKREQWQLTPVATATALSTVNTVAGVTLSPITFSGGWDPSGSMVTQNGESWFSAQNSLGYGANDIRAYVNFEKISFTRVEIPFRINNTATGLGYKTFTNCNAVCVATNGFLIDPATASAGSFKFTDCSCWGSGSVMFNIQTAAGPITLLRCVASGTNSSTGVLVSTASSPVVPSADLILLSCYMQNGGVAINSTGNVWAYDSTFSGNSIATIMNGTSYGGKYTFVRCPMTDATVSNFQNYANSYASFQNYNNTANDHRVSSDGFTGQTDLGTVHTGGVPSYKLSLTAVHRNTEYPAKWVITQPILCTSGVQVTVTCWMRRDSTNCTPSLVLPAGQIAGYTTADTSVSCTAAVNTWQQCSFNFTPTETGAVQLEFRASTTSAGVNCWITDLSLS